MEAMTYDPKRVATKYSRCVEESAIKKEGLPLGSICKCSEVKPNSDI